LSFCPSSALRLSLHSLAMRLQPRLEDEQKSCANLVYSLFPSPLKNVNDKKIGDYLIIPF